MTLEQIQIQTALEDQQRARDKHELEMRVMEAQLNGQAVQGTVTQQDRVEEDDFGENSLSPAQRQQLSLFPGQNKKDVIAIIKGTFLPRNLPHLDRNATAEAEPDYALVAASDGRLLQQKTTAKISAFGGTPKLWSKTFLIYAQILCVFFSTPFPTLIVPLLSFHARVLELADTYKWQDGVLNMALEWMERRRSTGQTDISAWELDTTFIDKYTRGREIGSRQPHSQGGGQSDSAQPKGFNPDSNTNHTGVICKLFNFKDSHDKRCQRDYKCSMYKGDHPAKGCDKKK